MVRKWTARTVLAVALMMGVTAGSSAVSAQGATPEPAPAPHPAHIHTGTCDELGNVVHPLEDVTGETLSGTPEATPESEDEGLPGDVLAKSRTTVDVSLEDLLAEPHAVNVHESAEAVDVYVACGNIEGEPEAGELILALEQLNDSGVTGQVILADIGEGQTEVTITLTDAAAEGFASPVATPTD